MNGYTNQYLANQIASASPEQLLLMFYDGAIRFTTLAMKAIEENDIPKRSYYINKASAIVTELDATLDRDRDPQLAENLDALYSYMLREYMSANRDNDVEPLKVIVTMLKELRETWAQAAAIYRQEQAGVAGQAAVAPGEPKKIAAAM